MSKDTTSSEYQELKTELRSLLISSQQGCTEHQVVKDYGAYNGTKQIPFRAMGYGSLIELLRSMPDVARIDVRGGQTIIHGVANDVTAHIKKMVMGQRSKKAPPRRNYPTPYTNRPSFNYRQRLPNQYAVGYSSHQPFHQVPPPYTLMYTTAPPLVPARQLFTTPHPFVPNPVRPNPTAPIRPSAAKSIASFPPREDSSATLIVSSSNLPAPRTTPTPDDSSSTIDDDTTNLEDDELMAYDQQQASIHGERIILLRRRIRQLLMKYTKGVWLANVHKLYQKLFSEEFNLDEFQLKNLMAFYECVADFVDSTRDPQKDSTDRILLLKPIYADAVKREQQTPMQITSNQAIPSPPTNSQSTIKTDEFIHRPVANNIIGSLIDRSAFVALDFRYKRLERGPEGPFEGFLGHVDDPWVICIGNKEFMPKREQMMTQLQDHYNQASNKDLYDIPFEQLEINLSCVYYHTNEMYYRAFIAQFDSSENNDVLQLKVYLVDYGVYVDDIRYNINPNALKFLHKDFSSLQTEVYDCRLANIRPSQPDSDQWPDEAKNLIGDHCYDKPFLVKITGYVESTLCVYLWLDDDCEQSVNELLIRNRLAVEFNDEEYPDFQPFSLPLTRTSPVPAVNGSHGYIDERLFSRQEQENIEHPTKENRFKHFIISIEHAYYFVKQPFTSRPCLPCFEVARLLAIDEANIPRLNLIRETKIPFRESDQELFRDLRQLPESSKCPHLNCSDAQSAVILYDLSAVQYYLREIKFQDGDVTDALLQEFENYQRPGYWNEKRSSYICKSDLPSHTDDLNRRKEIFAFRRDQLRSSSTNHLNSHEMHDIEGHLQSIDHRLDSLDNILPSTSSTKIPSAFRSKVSRERIRETRLRIARPFDQQFGLNVCFDHRTITHATIEENDEDLEDRFQDLHRIAKNILQFFHLEPNLIHEQDRALLNEVQLIITDLLENIAFDRRIEIYNYCLEVAQLFQPVIQSYTKRTDMMDVI